MTSAKHVVYTTRVRDQVSCPDNVAPLRVQSVGARVARRAVMHNTILVALLLGGCQVASTTPWSTRSPPPSPSPTQTPPRGAERVGGRNDPGEERLAERDARRAFVSTKETAAKLNGLPGMPCAPSDAHVVDGPCWDPPGGLRALPMAHLQPGVRQMETPDWAHPEPRAVYWFDMPREATPDHDRLPLVPDARNNPPTRYVPYHDGGFVRPALPAMKGRTVDAVVAAFDQLDMPFALTFVWRDCDAAHDTVCEVKDPNPRSSSLTLAVANRIKHRGTDREERKLPAGLEGRPTDEVLAELRRIGFTNVVVVEKQLPCNRGVVCSAPRAGWHRTTQVIELEVRRAPQGD